MGAGRVSVPSVFLLGQAFYGWKRLFRRDNCTVPVPDVRSVSVAEKNNNLEICKKVATLHSETILERAACIHGHLDACRAI